MKSKEPKTMADINRLLKEESDRDIDELELIAPDNIEDTFTNSPFYEPCKIIYDYIISDKPSLGYVFYDARALYNVHTEAAEMFIEYTMNKINNLPIKNHRKEVERCYKEFINACMSGMY
jgi:hypothetical protein